MKKELEGLFEGFQAGDLWILQSDEGEPIEAYPVLGHDRSQHPVCWGGAVLGDKFQPSAELLATGEYFQAKNYKGWRPKADSNGTIH